MLARQKARVALLPLVEAFEARKRAMGSIDYADQVAHAARIAVAAARGGPPRAGALEGRAARRVPGHQRRAAADARGAVRRRHRPPGPGRRRPAAVDLRLARCVGRHHRALRPHLPRPRSAGAPSGSPWPRAGATTTACSPWPTPSPAMLPPPEHPLPDLAPAPTAGRGAVTVGLYDTIADETAALADRLAACWRGEDPVIGRRADGRPPTVAVLARTRKQLPGIAAALRERGLPVEVVGLGGLLEVPEVSDVVATLTVLVDPTAGDALGRLLTGARWRIGPRDLAALEARARALVHSRRPPRPADEGAAPVAEAPVERGSIVEALDDLGDPDGYSPDGPPPAAPAGRGAGAPAQPAGGVAARPGRRGRPHPRPGDRAGQRTRTPARPAPAPTSTRCTASPRSSPSWPSCRRCRRSSATCATPRSASAAWSRARWRSTRRRCSCSPGTPPRAWSGTSSPCPG